MHCPRSIYSCWRGNWLERANKANEAPALERDVWVVPIAGSTGSALRAVRPPSLHITPDVRRDLVHAVSARGSL